MRETRPHRTPRQDSAPPPGRRCPKCHVTLEHQRSYVTKGLTGILSVEHRFSCPACDACYRWSSRDQRWREVH